MLVSSFGLLSASHAIWRAECNTWRSRCASCAQQAERRQCAAHKRSRRPLTSSLRCLLSSMRQLELQSASRRSSLLDLPSTSTASTASSFASFPSDGHASYVVSDRLVEPGLHCLVCSISYRDSGSSGAPSSAAPLTYQKFFKFNVLSAVSVASVVHARDDWLLAELTVTNSTQRPLRLTKVDIDTRSEQAAHTVGGGGYEESHASKVERASGFASPSASAHFSVQPINHLNSASSPTSPLRPLPDSLLAPSASRSYLFRLDQLSVDSRRVVDIGRVSIEWRQLMGEGCQLTAACAVHRTAKTSSAQMSAPPQSSNSSTPSLVTAATSSPVFPAFPPGPTAARPSDVSVQLVSCPATAVLEQPFSVRLLVVNPLPVALHRCQLLLMRDKMGSVLPVGKSRLFLPVGGEIGGAGDSGGVSGTLQPRSSHMLDLTLAGIGLGVHKIGGLRILAQSASAPPIQLDFDALQHIEIVSQE